MSRYNLLPLIVLLLSGLTLVIFGVLIRAGRIRYWWASRYYAAGQEPFVTLPGGAFLLALFVALVLPPRFGAICFLAAAGCGLSALVFVVVQPRFLKPEWLRWLEDNHAQSVCFLQKKARAMGAFRWAKRVATQEDLEKWVDEALSGRA